MGYFATRSAPTMERYHIFKLGLAVLFYAAYCIRPMVVHGQKIDNEVHTDNQTKKFDEEELVFYQGVQGKPGVDFPVLSHIPRTSFNCRDVDSGYYADLETDCQVFHICEENKKISFLCPNGTIFQQSELICEWWFKVNCTNSPSLYEESAEQLREENAKRKLSRRVQNHGAVMRTEERSSVSRGFDNRSSKKVSSENRANNHAPTYRDDFDQSNDLSRSPSSDFVRDRNLNQPTPFQKQNRNEEPNRSNQRGRKPVQFQHQPSVDNEERRVVPARKNSQRAGTRRPVSTGRINQEQEQDLDYDFGRQNAARRNNNNNYNGHQASFNDRKEIRVNQDQTQDDFSTNRNLDYDFGRQNSARRNEDRNNNNNNNDNQANFNTRNEKRVNQNQAQDDFGTDRNLDYDFGRQNSARRNKEDRNNNNNNNDNQPNFNSRNEKRVNQNQAQDDFSTDRNLDYDFGRQNSARRNENRNNNNNNNKHNANQATFNNRKEKSFVPSQNHQPNGFRQSTSFGSRTTESARNNFNSFQQSNRNDHSRRVNTGFSRQFSSDHDREVTSTTESSNFHHSTSFVHQKPTNPETTTASYSKIDSGRQRFDNHNYDDYNSGTTQTRTSFTSSNRNYDNFNSGTTQKPTSVNSNNHNYNDFSSGNTQKPASFTHNNHNYGNDFNSGTTQKPTAFTSSSHNHDNFNSDSTQKPASFTSNNNNYDNNFNSGGTQKPTDFTSSTYNYDDDFNSGTTRNQGSFISTEFKVQINSNKQEINLNTDNRSFKEQTIGTSSTDSDKNYVPEPTQSTPNQETKTSVSTNQPDVVSTGTQKPVSTNRNNKASTFPNSRQEKAFSTTSQQKKLSGKDGTLKQKSTVALTKNDIINRRLEGGDSDEAQITQETASFYKNSFNRIDQNYKSTSPNPYPNHRETYSELKEPQYYSTKTFSGISSVTPQYLTTQPINNGRPFVGSQVGTTLRGTDKSKSFGTTVSYFTTTVAPDSTTTENPTTTKVVPISLFNTGRTDKSLRPTALSTASAYSPKPAANVTVPPQGSFNLGSTSTYRPKTDSSTSKIIDHATVYGKFVKSDVTTPSAGKSTIVLSKSLFGGVTPTPFSLPITQKTLTTSSGRTLISLSKSVFGGATPAPFSKSTQFPSSTAKTSAEILSVSDSFNRGTPQVRFFGKVQTTTKIPGVEIHVNGNSIGFTTPKPFSKTTSSDTGKSSPFGFKSFSTTSKPFSSSTPVPLSAQNHGDFESTFKSGTTPSTVSSFGTTVNPEFNSVTPLSFSTYHPDFNSVTPTTYFTSTINDLVTPTVFNSFGTETPTQKSFGTTYTPQTKVSGFFVTKNAVTVPTQRSLISDIIRPRPFQLPPEPNFSGKPIYTSTTTENGPTPTYPTYKISSASPFANPSTPEPTQPTPFTTPQPTLPSTFENVDSMISALAEMASHNNYSSDPRPGLVIPPSAGPQTLHTLAVYFANALDGIAAEKEEEEEQEEEKEDEDSLTKLELEKKRLTELLTQMTMDRYNELFSEENEGNEETTTITSRVKSDEEDLEGQHSKGPAQATPKVRQLAKVFTQALSSYLDDPATFKKVLEEVRPTEPPALENEDTDLGDDELLNFSDADSKSSFPPFFPTPSAARPTWGYLIAFNTTNSLDVKNSINPDLENLQGADSQSFVSQFNKLHNSNKDDVESTTKSSTQLPDDHWTTSPDVGKLWKKAFSFDPASINENFGTTEPIPVTTEAETEEPELTIKYELRALPQLELNSTQVHGILIDFMNTTGKDDDNRLQRILRKLNTTEDEFLEKMKEIENNPLTRRLILLLISECGNSTMQVDTSAVPVHTFLSRTVNSTETLETSSSIGGFGVRHHEDATNSDLKIVDPSLSEDSQDARALQLLNSLYTIASKFGK
ncbi:mucin-2 isoform X1 [Zophobas morio]|uniref:mucin-2 isoform X1 n=2 Tax=Zophobas morio TaxID=2755281 RepID=UPI003083723B